MKTCTECGTEFHARADAAYCSTACRQRAYRHRNANRNVPSAVGAGVPVAATIGSLISESDRITSELEKHTADMNYPGTDEFNAHTFPRHPFDDSAYEVLHDLAERMEQVSNDLYSAEEERQSYAALTPQQKTARTQEMEEIAEDTEASAGRETEWERGGAARDSLGGVAAGIDGAGPLPRVRQEVRAVRWPGRNDKRHPSVLGVLPAQPGWPLTLGARRPVASSSW